MRRLGLTACTGLAFVLACSLACGAKNPGNTANPDAPAPPGTKEEEARKAFDLLSRGLGHLDDENQQTLALEAFEELIRLVPDEPAGHVNAAIAILGGARKGTDPEPHARRALKIEEGNPYAWAVLGEIAADDRQWKTAAERFQRSIQGSPNDPIFRYRLVEMSGMIERTLRGKERRAKDPDQKAQVARDLEVSRRRLTEALEELATLVPHNMKVRLELAEAYRALGEKDKALKQLRRLEASIPFFDEQAEELYDTAITSLEKGELKGARTGIMQLQNVIKFLPVYKVLTVDQIKTGQLGVPPAQPALSPKIMAKLPPATPPEPIPVKFVAEEPIREAAASFCLIDADLDGDQDLYVASDTGVVLRNDKGSFAEAFPGVDLPAKGVESALAIDLENDHDLDLILAGPEGLAVYVNGFIQESEGQRDEEKSPVSFGEKTPKEIRNAAKGRALLHPVDYDHDGDLDLLVGQPSAPSRFLRNNGDGTYPDMAEAAGIRGTGARQAASADIDGDGDLDILVLGQGGEIVLYSNLRQAQLEAISLPSEGGPFTAVALLDMDNDGMLDVAAAGAALRLLRGVGKGKFESAGEAALPDGFDVARLISLDYDNDGFRDLAAAGAKGLALLRNVGQGRFVPAPAEVPDVGAIADLAAADTDRDGDLDLILLGEAGLRVLRNDGGNKHNWLEVRFRGLPHNDQLGRVNRFALGSPVELQAGDLYQMGFVDGSATHFGLGPRKKVDAFRVVWANGIPQNHFDQVTRVDLEEEATLKGSCPFLYAWNGTRFVFVTDCLGGSPLGLKVDETRYAWIDREDYVKIRGDQLRPKEGKYILQVTEELWETLYYDEGELLVVDHPGDVEIFPDDKFAPPPFPKAHIHAVGDLSPVRGARDTAGNDVLPALLEKDGVYVVDFERARYQGVVDPHSLTLDLGDLKDAKRIRLFLNGWIYWSDTSINVAIGQNSSIQTHPPALSVPDGSGGWKVVTPFMGFPAGKTKTVVHDLTGLFQGDDYRVRIETNLEIYWDQALVSTEPGEATHRVTRLHPSSANVHFRGFSRMWRDGPNSPHLYDYKQVTREHRWRDMEGLYTRYGDVTELVQATDDRFVIFGAGDEVTLRFDATAAPALPEGWRRDFLLRSVGYDKDGDLNTTYGQTVLPLPFAAMSGYPYGPEESYPDDEVHRRYQEKYNTRWVGQEGFRAYVRSGEALRSRSRGPAR